MDNFRIVGRHAFVFGAALILASCAAPRDTEHHIVISVRDQKLALLQKDNLVATYPISTSKFGLGDRPGSFGTPLGELEIADKIGDGAPAGTVFKDRRRTGEIVGVNAPGRDPIVTIGPGCLLRDTRVGAGAQVSIVQSPLVAVIPELNSASQMAETNHAIGVIR